MTSPLGEFVDAYTMQWVREYPHPIDLVWEAVTTPEHLDVWLLPFSTVEPREGGFCSFSWGGPAEGAQEGTVTVFDPPRAVQYTMGDNGNCIRFDLEPVASGTRLVFTQSFVPGTATDADDSHPGADQPAGPESPWRPGFTAGFHEFLDDLAEFLAGRWTAADRRAHLELLTAGHFEQEELVAAYREHIANTCPRS